MSTQMPAAQAALRTYLAHIGYRGEPKPDLDTLAELSRLHQDGGGGQGRLVFRI